MKISMQTEAFAQIIKELESRLAALGVDYDDYVKFREDVNNVKKVVKEETVWLPARELRLKMLDELINKSLLIWDAKAETVDLSILGDEVQDEEVREELKKNYGTKGGRNVDKT
jgi:hypothetical protein